MVKVILVSHGRFAAAIKDSCEMVIGKQEYIRAVCLDEQQGIESFKEEFAAALAEMEKEDTVLCISDIFFGSPFNGAVEILEGSKGAFSYKIMTGLNLPMLIELCMGVMSGSADLEEIANAASHAGSEGITVYQKEQEETEKKIGAGEEKASFLVHVQFRQNATWQGTITWVNKGETQHFRSVLEMIRLMTEAVESAGEGTEIRWVEE